MSKQHRLWCVALIAALLCAHPGTSLAFPLAESADLPLPANAGRILWPLNGVGFCVSDGYQGFPRLVSDGLHGAIAVWADARPAANGLDIYAQRLGAEGAPLWAANGIPVSAADNDQTEPQAISDGSGGALVAWNDQRSGAAAIYAQRVDSTGAALWAAGGLSVVTGSADYLLSALLSDGSGGAFVIWEAHVGQERLDTNLFAQRLSPAGALLWTTPATITLAAGEQYDPTAAPDGSGGFIVAWADLRNPADQNLYAQRISASGAALWAADGVAVSSDPAFQRLGYLTSDGQGGAFVAWADFRASASMADAYLMRLTASGARAWVNDLPVAAAADLAEEPSDLVADDSGGAILMVAAADASGAAGADLLAQRVDAAGAFVWGPQPLNVTPWPEQQTLAAAIPDGRGGVYLAWSDKFANAPSDDMMTQHLDSQGAPQWSGHGVAVVTLPGMQDRPRLLSDGARGVIVGWQDYRNDAENPDLYAQRISDINQAIFPLIRNNSH